MIKMEVDDSSVPPSSSMMSSSSSSSSSSSVGLSGNGGEGSVGKYYHFWRSKCDQLEKENRILRATNKHLKTLLKNANSEIDSLKVLVSELEESCQTKGLIPNFRDLEGVKDEDDQGNGPLSLLPEEVWGLILDNLEDSADIQNFCKAYPSWDIILHRTKQAWLFDQIFPLLFPYLSRKDTLQCRLTCKRWLHAVDFFLENNQVRRPPKPDWPGPVLRLRKLSSWMWSNKFMSNDITLLKWELLNREACGHPRNPILGRCATFKFEPECTHSILFLQKFGEHIWYLRIESRQNGASWLFWRLVEILPLVPNLKKLDVAIRPIGAPSGVIPGYLEVLEEQWKQNHLPHLPHLESLEISEHDLFHGYILKNVLISTYAGQIRRLGINQYSLNSSFSSRLTHLTELTLSADTDQQMESVLRLNSPVMRLTLYITYNDHDVSQDYPSLQLVFRAVDHFKNSLRSLYIHFPGPHSSVNWSALQHQIPPLQLPHLTTLGMRECTPLSFNLIANLASSLKYLHIYSYRAREGVSPLDYDSVHPLPGEILDIHQWLQNPQLVTSECNKARMLYHSNMWTLLPKLRLFTVTMDNNEQTELSYSREIYDNLVRDNERVMGMIR